MLSQTAFLSRSVMPHGESGACVGIPADVRRDTGLEAGDNVDLEYNREESTLTIHLPD